MPSLTAPLPSLRRTARQILVVSAFATAVLLTGCAATVEKASIDNAALSVSPPAKAKVAVKVQAAPGMVASGSWEALRADWRDGMALAAGQHGMTLDWLQAEQLPDNAPAVLALIKVRHFRHMDTAERMLGGALAGDAYVNTEVEFFEWPANKRLGSRVYSASTSFKEGIFSATSRKQVQAISEEIVSEIQR